MVRIMGMIGTVRLILLSIATSGFAIEKNPPVLPIPPAAECQEWSVDGSFLIWQSKEWGLGVAAKSFERTGLGTVLKSLDEKSFIPDFAWRSGVKINVGRLLPYDDWDTQIRWIYYHGQLTNLKRIFESVVTEGIGIIPLWSYPFYTIADNEAMRYGFAESLWKLYFNSLDWELGRVNLLVDPVSVRLHVGVKGAWLRQTFYVEYTGGNEIEVEIPGSAGTDTLQLNASNLAFQSEAWGLGPRAGFGTHWLWGWNISAFAEGAFTLLYSSFQVTRNQTDQGVLEDEAQSWNMQLTDNFWRATPVGELMLGFDWKRECTPKGHTIGVLVRIAYEAQYWWAQNGFRRNYINAAPATTEQMRGDLQMHGLTATLGVDF